MSRSQKILTTALWGLLVVLMIGLIASWASLGGNGDDARRTAAAHSDTAPPLAAMPAFDLLDQDGKPFSADSMKGKVWIVDFIFTTCTGPCPLMTRRMASLQKQIADERVRLLSFSVDPKTDTPDVFKQYGREHGADFARWTFLTGDERTIHTTSHKLLLGVSPAEGDQPIMHSTKLVLVGPDGQVRGYYDSNEPAALTKLAADAQRLAAAAEPPAP